MKISKTIASLMLITILFLNLTSCLVIHQKKDNGLHKGWFKSQQGPHPQAPGNSGKVNGKSNGHPKK
jgi:hypothetical protein